MANELTKKAPGEPDKNDGTRTRPLARWQQNFLKVLRKTPHVSRACKAARVSRSMAYDHRKSNPGFAEQWRDAIEGSVDELEATAFRLATEGDSSLISFLLRCHRPEIYRDRQEVAVAGGIIFLPEKKEGCE